MRDMGDGEEGTGRKEWEDHEGEETWGTKAENGPRSSRGGPSWETVHRS